MEAGLFGNTGASFFCIAHRGAKRHATRINDRRFGELVQMGLRVDRVLIEQLGQRLRV